jgi:glycosyltransferase involved in cell wall biosynthesis
VERLGFVDNLDSELARASVVLSPARRGRGVRIKNLEAMAHGVPLVTTTLGSHGLGDGSADGFAVADGASDLARVTAGLLDDPDRAEAMGAAGRSLVARCHTRKEQARLTLDAWRESAGR